MRYRIFNSPRSNIKGRWSEAGSPGGLFEFLESSTESRRRERLGIRRSCRITQEFQEESEYNDSSKFARVKVGDK